MSLLQVAGLCKTFGEVRAASDVCFEVRAGEIYGLLGPNGAGKTTAISMISGLLRPDAGKVAVDGADFWSDPTRRAEDHGRGAAGGCALRGTVRPREPGVLGTACRLVCHRSPPTRRRSVGGVVAR